MRLDKKSLGLLLVSAMLALGACAQTPVFEPSVGQAGKDVGWVPTPDVLVNKMLDMAKVVTAVEGAAFGMGLAVASDYTVAASNSRFAAAQIRRGLCPGGYMYYTVRARCGPGRAREIREILLSGREVSAAEAERYGIVHELVEPGKALEAAMTDSYHTLEACFRAEQDYQPIVGLSRDHKESVAAFLEKRKAVYTGE